MFTKILLTVVVVALIWFGFKYAGRMSELREKREAKQKARPVAGTGFRDEVRDAQIKDLVKCPVCNTFRASDAGSCGRRDCPY